MQASYFALYFLNIYIPQILPQLTRQYKLADYWERYANSRPWIAMDTLPALNYNLHLQKLMKTFAFDYVTLALFEDCSVWARLQPKAKLAMTIYYVVPLYQDHKCKAETFAFLSSDVKQNMYMLIPNLYLQEWT